MGFGNQFNVLRDVFSADAGAEAAHRSDQTGNSEEAFLRSEDAREHAVERMEHPGWLSRLLHRGS
jgi:hypothetical protein